jgi:predicted transcriptional regulator
MLRTRGFLHITYVLYHHLDKVSGTKKANCLSVYLSLMKYCWKSNDYKAGLRHSTIQKDTGLSRTTIHRTLQTLTKLNIISTIKGRSGKTYSINNKFIKYETGMFQKYTSNVSNVKTLEETLIYNNTIDKIIGKYKGDTQSIVDNLAVLPLSDLENNLIKNPYFIKLAIERKEEMARQKNLVDPQIIQRELKKITKEKNFAYKRKKEYNIRNNLDYKGNPIGKNKD